MGNSYVKDSAFARKDLLQKDILFKQKFYYSKGAHYETATLSAIKLLPPSTLLNDLKADYDDMKDMFYGKYPDFDTIIEYLKKLQDEIHRLV